MQKIISLYILVVFVCALQVFADNNSNIKNETKNIQQTKMYDENLKKYYTKNDVIAFVYKWFAGFDHQKLDEYFTKHLDPQNIDMEFPDFPIHSVADFKRWYQGVKDSISYNTHTLSNVNVYGNEKDGFFVNLDVNWKAKTYDKQNYDMIVSQKWKVIVDKNKNFIIIKHKAWLKK